MKKSKYLVVLPLALAVLASCGGNNYSEIDLKKAQDIADSYLPSIKNNKAAAITVGGHVNSIKIKGDMTYWSYTKPFEDIKLDETLLTLIPNFELKDGEINVDSHDIAAASIPASLASVAEIAMKDSRYSEYALILNLPKFPMNRNMLKAAYGFEKLVIDKENERIDWDKTESKEWKYAKVNFYAGGGKLKVTIETDDLITFFNEVVSAVSGQPKPEPDPTEKKYPLNVSVTTNNIGYIDSLSVKTKIEGIKFKSELPNIMYVSANADLEADFTLNFTQKFTKPITLKYQLSVYDKPDFTQGEMPDITWYRDISELSTGIPLKLKEVKGPTTSLDTFKDYVTFDWYKNIDEDDNLKKIYDDPFFNFDYWDRACNVAFIDESYDAIVVPTYDATNNRDAYSILGAFPCNPSFLGGEPINKSFVSTSIDGRIISTDNGLPTENTKTYKALESAGDALTRVRRMVEEQEVTSYVDEIFINSNMLNLSDSEYIINIAVAPYLGGE